MFSVVPLSALSRLRIIGIRDAPPVVSTTSTCAQPNLLSFNIRRVMSAVRATSDAVSFSSQLQNQGSTVPLKLRLTCGSEILGSEDINPAPEIVALVGVTTGPVDPLDNINGANGANPADPRFSCGTNRCEYQLRTEDLLPDDYIVSIEMPDTRIFEAGFTVVP